MLWLRAALFSVLVPGTIGIWIPLQLAGAAHAHSGWEFSGWLLLIAGAFVYVRSLLSFVTARGTPAIFFTRRLSFLLGEEPPALVRRDLYRWTRNPMYLSVIASIFGQAILFHSLAVFVYGILVAVCFHFVVLFLEEPHLRLRSPSSFDEYCRSVPRWFGIPTKRNNAARS